MGAEVPKSGRRETEPDTGLMDKAWPAVVVWTKPSGSSKEMVEDIGWTLPPGASATMSQRLRRISPVVACTTAAHRTPTTPVYFLRPPSRISGISSWGCSRRALASLATVTSRASRQRRTRRRR